MLKRFLQKVHDNFSSIERKDDLLFPLKDCFQDREASETNRPDVSQSKTAPFLSRLLEIPFRLFERFLSKLFQHLLSGFLKLPYIVFFITEIMIEIGLGDPNFCAISLVEVPRYPLDINKSVASFKIFAVYLCCIDGPFSTCFWLFFFFQYTIFHHKYSIAFVNQPCIVSNHDRCFILSFDSFAKISTTSRAFSESKLAVGSSARIMDGSLYNARAIATLAVLHQIVLLDTC